MTKDVHFNLNNLDQAAGTSPESIFLMFLLTLARQWWENLINLDKDQVRRSMIGFISLAVPDEAAQKALWAEFEVMANQRNSDEFVAACHIMGKVCGQLTRNLGLLQRDFVEFF